MKFQKRGQLFICTHNVTPSVVSIRISNEDPPPVAIHSYYAAPTPTGFAEIVST